MVPLLLNVPKEDREVSLPLNFELDNTVKTLGVHWNPATDDFKYVVKLNTRDTVTKRHLVSEIAKILDPVGWLAPVVVTAKILHQKLWLLGLDWDVKFLNLRQTNGKTINSCCRMSKKYVFLVGFAVTQMLI